MEEYLEIKEIFTSLRSKILDLKKKEILKVKALVFHNVFNVRGAQKSEGKAPKEGSKKRVERKSLNVERPPLFIEVLVA